MSLNNDTSRCLDSSCRLHETCARWVERESGRVRQETFARGLLPCCSFVPLRAAEAGPDQVEMFYA